MESKIKMEYRNQYLYITIPKILKYDTETHYKYDFQNKIFYAKFDDKYFETSLKDCNSLCKCYPTIAEYINQQNNQNQNNIYNNCNTINKTIKKQY